MRRGFHADRLGVGDWLNAVASTALLVTLVVWHQPWLTTVLAAATCGLGLVACATLALRPSPAVPIALVTLQLPLALLTAIAVALGARPLRYVELAISLLVLAGSYGALRREGVPVADQPADVEVVPLRHSAP